MSDLYPKYIIVDGKLIISKVEYHNNILCEEFDHEKEPHRIKGGGWFRIKDKVMTFHGESSDFGRATLEDVKKAVEDKQVFTNIYELNNISDDYKFCYDTQSEIIELN